MNIHHITDTNFHGPETTTLMELVAVVSDLTDNDRETIQVVRHMLRSQTFSCQQQLQLD